ncbi:cytochrome p450, partial [Moniliophthora roreri]
ELKVAHPTAIASFEGTGNNDALIPERSRRRHVGVGRIAPLEVLQHSDERGSFLAQEACLSTFGRHFVSPETLSLTGATEYVARATSYQSWTGC